MAPRTGRYPDLPGSPARVRRDPAAPTAGYNESVSKSPMWVSALASAAAGALTTPIINHSGGFMSFRFQPRRRGLGGTCFFEHCCAHATVYAEAIPIVLYSTIRDRHSVIVSEEKPAIRVK